MNHKIPTGLFNTVGSSLQEYGDPSKTDDKLTQWIKAAESSGSDAKALFTAMNLVGKIPKGIEILLKIHGITPLAKFLMLRAQQINGIAAQKREKYIKEKESKDKQALKELEKIEERDRLFSVSDKTSVFSSELEFFNQMAIESDEEDISKLFQNANLLFWLNIDPYNPPKSTSDLEAYQKNLIDLDKALSGITSIDQLNAKIDLLASSPNDVLLRKKLEHIKQRVEKGENLTDILTEVKNLNQVLTLFNPEELLDLLSNYREIWIASNAENVIPFHPDLAKTDTMTTETREAFRKVGFENSDPVMQLGFITYPNQQDLDNMDRMLGRMGDTVGDHVVNALEVVKEVSGAKRRKVGDILNGFNSNDFNVFTELTNSFNDCLSQIENLNVTLFSPEDKVNASSLMSEFLKLDPLEPSFRQRYDTLRLQLFEIINKDQGNTHLIELITNFVGLVSAVFSTYKEQVSVLNSTGTEPALDKFLDMFIFLNANNGWSKLSLTYNGDFKALFSGRLPTEDELNRLYKDNINARRGSVQAIKRANQKGLREAYILHLEDLSKGRVIALNNIKDPTERDPQGVIDSIISEIDALESISMVEGEEYIFQVQERIMADLSKIGGNVPSRLFDFGELFSTEFQSQEGKSTKVLEVELKHVGPDSNGNESEVKKEFKRFISVSQRVVKILKQRQLELMQNVTNEAIPELDYISDLLERFSALGIRYSPISNDVEVNYRLFAMYFNGVHTYMPTAKLSDLEQDLVQITDKTQYSPNKVYLGGKLKVKRPEPRTEERGNERTARTEGSPREERKRKFPGEDDLQIEVAGVPTP